MARRRRDYFESRRIIGEQIARIREDLYAGRLDRSDSVSLTLEVEDVSVLGMLLEHGEYNRRRLDEVDAALREIAAESKDAAALLRRANLIPTAEADRNRRSDWIARAYADLSGQLTRGGGWAPRDASLIAMPLLQEFPSHKREVAIYALAKCLQENPEKLQRSLYGNKQIRGRAKEAREEYILELLEFRRMLHGELDEESNRKQIETLPECPPLLSVPHESRFDEFLTKVRKNMPIWEGGDENLRTDAIRSLAKYLGISPTVAEQALSDPKRIVHPDLREHPRREWIWEHLQIWRRIHGEMPEELGGNRPPAYW